MFGGGSFIGEDSRFIGNGGADSSSVGSDAYNAKQEIEEERAKNAYFQRVVKIHECINSLINDELPPDQGNIAINYPYSYGWKLTTGYPKITERVTAQDFELVTFANDRLDYEHDEEIRSYLFIPPQSRLKLGNLANHCVDLTLKEVGGTEIFPFLRGALSAQKPEVLIRTIERE